MRKIYVFNHIDGKAKVIEASTFKSACNKLKWVPDFCEQIDKNKYDEYEHRQVMANINTAVDGVASMFARYNESGDLNDLDLNQSDPLGILQMAHAEAERTIYYIFWIEDKEGKKLHGGITVDKVNGYEKLKEFPEAKIHWKGPTTYNKGMQRLYKIMGNHGIPPQL